MKWTRGTQNDDVIDARGAKPKGAVIAGGSIGAAVVIFLVAKVLGVDVSGLFGGGSSNSSTGAPSTKEEKPQGPDPDAELVDYVKYVMKDIQDAFDAEFRRIGKPYQRAKLKLFTQAVDTGCGRSSAAIGPFYCPPDSMAYIDLSFYRDLRARFGAPGDFAQAYVLAHEMGHHLQNLLGVEQERRNYHKGETRNQHSVRVELQADCYAGVWGNSAQKEGILEQGDFEEALNAAAAVGDDKLQKQGQGYVVPDSFTHGTSAQRASWFKRGFQSGDINSCDTFSGSI